MKISIVIPAHNEEKRITRTLNSYSEYFENLRVEEVLDYEVIVSINNTSDGTQKIVREFIKKNRRIKCLNLVRGGKGYAIIEGFKESLKNENDLIGFVDADMATSPQEYHKLLSSMGNSDGVIASRWIKGAVVSPKPLFRRMVARWMFNTLIRAILFLSYKDTQCGAKIFRRRVVEEVIHKITMSQWAFDVDLLYQMKKKGFRIKEIPTIWTDKEYSKINFWAAGPWMALGVIRLRLINLNHLKSMGAKD